MQWSIVRVMLLHLVVAFAGRCPYCAVPVIRDVTSCVGRQKNTTLVIDWRSKTSTFRWSFPLFLYEDAPEVGVGALRRGYIDMEEEWIITYAQKFNRPSLFVDVGANVGKTSFPIVAQSPGHHVIAIEPVSRNVDNLCQTLLSNNYSTGFGAHFQLVHGAASSSWGTTRIHVPGFRSDNAALSSNAAVKNVGGSAVAEMVTTFPIDDYIDSLLKRNLVPAGGIKGIKIDTQGHEAKVLMGLNRTLTEVRQLVIFAENDVVLMQAAGVDRAAMYTFMRARGFTAYCNVDIAVKVVDNAEVIVPSGAPVLGDNIECYDVIWVKAQHN